MLLTGLQVKMNLPIHSFPREPNSYQLQYIPGRDQHLAEPKALTACTILKVIGPLLWFFHGNIKK